MGMFSGMVRRANTDLAKVEDLTQVYTSEPWTKIYSNVYRGKYFKICSGCYPYIRISDADSRICFGSTHTQLVRILDHQNSARLSEMHEQKMHNKILTRTFFINYNSDSDYIPQCQETGKKHSLQMLIQDAHAFINQILDYESKSNTEEDEEIELPWL